MKGMSNPKDTSVTVQPTFHGEDGSGHTAAKRKGNTTEKINAAHRKGPTPAMKTVKSIGGE